MDDIAQGVNPIRERNGVDGSVALYVPMPELQFRHLEKVFLDGAPKLEWSQWFKVDLVKEGAGE